jgi:hypothetical protein
VWFLKSRSIEMANPNIRRPEETQQQYRERQRREKASTPGYFRMLWPAYLGTYVKAVHGVLDGNYPSSRSVRKVAV